MDSLHTENLIIGAGPAGLAMAGQLRRVERPFILLEQSQQVANAWRNHYDRLHLHTIKATSHLPFKPFPAHFPQYIPRQMLVDYYDEYQREMEIQPHFGQEVVAIRRAEGGGWTAATAQGRLYTAERVILCTGFNRLMHMPIWPGQDEYRGSIEHSRSYKNGQPYVNQTVLVVGMGNTGAEIALDLVEAGARPSISLRGPINIIPRDVLGRPTQQTAMLLAKLPTRLGDAIGILVRKLTVGDLSRYGIATPALPPAAQLRTLGQTPVIDLGTVAHIKAGRIQIVPAIQQFKEDSLLFTDGQTRQFDHVILATGYHTGVSELVENGRQLLNHLGHPAHWRGMGEHAGLYLLGYDAYSTGGLLNSIRLQSAEIAAEIRGEK